MKMLARLAALLALIATPAFASQTYAPQPTTGTLTGLQAVINMNANSDALLTMNAGTTAPAYATEGTLFANTTSNSLSIYDGSTWNTICTYSAGTCTGSGGGGSSAFSGLLAATTTNNINNGTLAQQWRWDTLAANNALTLTSTATAGNLFSLSETTTGAGNALTSTVTGAANTGSAGLFTNASTSGFALKAVGAATVSGNFTGAAAAFTGTVTGVASNWSGAMTGTSLALSSTLTGVGATFSGALSDTATSTFNNVNITGTCTGCSSGSGVSAGTLGQMTWYGATGSVVSGNANATISNGALTLGVAGTTIGQLKLSGNTSGTIIVTPPAVAGSGTLTLPVATDTLTGKATTDTFTNKTFDTAGTGNSFKIAGTSITSISGNSAIAASSTGTYATGDIVIADANDNMSDSGLLASNQKVRAITYIIDGGGSAITTGIKGDLYVPFACTITQSTLLVDQTGSIVVNVWKIAYASYPSTVTNKITSSAPPTISSAVKAQDSTLTGWTTSISAGDTLRFNVDSASTVTRATLILNCNAS